MIEVDDDGQKVIIQFRSRTSCMHSFLEVDEDLEKVFCGKCGESLNPFFVIKRMMRFSEKWRRQKAEADLAREEAEKKTRTKCDHCGKMTRVNVKVSSFKVIERTEEMKGEEL